MAIDYRCEQCGKTGRTRDEYAGRIVKCPGCGGSMEVPHLAWAVEDPPEPPPVSKGEQKQEKAEGDSAVPEFRFSVKQLLLRFAFVSAALTFLLSMHTDATLGHYLAILVLLGLSSYVAVRKAGSRMPRLAWGVSAVVSAALFGAWLSNDYYVQTYIRAGDAGETWLHRDYFWRWGAWRYKKEASTTDQPDVAHHKIESRFSRSGKIHGRVYESIWPTSSHPATPADWELAGFEKSVLGVYSSTEWYWYGEKITEGEWHLRNK